MLMTLPCLVSEWLYTQVSEEVRHGDSLVTQSIHSICTKLKVIKNNKMIRNVLIESPTSHRVVPPLLRCTSTIVFFLLYGVFYYQNRL